MMRIGGKVVLDVGKAKYKTTEEDSPEFLRGILGRKIEIPEAPSPEVYARIHSLDYQIKLFRKSRMLDEE